jgi:hypothetical protein
MFLQLRSIIVFKLLLVEHLLLLVHGKINLPRRG